MRGKSGIPRALCVSAVRKRIVIVHALEKKTQKTPCREIVTAFEFESESDRTRCRECDEESSATVASTNTSITVWMVLARLVFCNFGTQTLK